MDKPITSVVPRNISRAKRVAKQLQDIYSRRPLSACQATTSHLFGHKDWHALEQAINREAPSAPFDDDLTVDGLSARRQTQIHLICRELGGVDLYADYSRPAEPPHKSSLTEAEFAAYVLALEGQKSQRLEKAAVRWHIFMAEEVIREIEPTAVEAPRKRSYPDLFTLYTSDQLAAMPGALGRWWRHNIPHQPLVSDALEAYDLNPHRSVSLINFGGYWGELCFHYASTIDWTMAIGVAYLVAERYGAICVHESDALADCMSAIDRHAPESEQARLLQVVNDSFSAAMQQFFDSYPRDDFAEVFAKQPGSFKANAREVIKILASPRSKKGTW